MSNDNPVFRARRQLFYDALRSNRFKQGTGMLTRYPGASYEENCCLGVACTVARENGLNTPFLDVDDTRYYLADIYQEDVESGVIDDNENDGYDNSESLPGVVQEWYGFKDSDPDLEAEVTDDRTGTTYTTDLTASTLNDDKGFTFVQIADAFERTYPAILDMEESGGTIEP